MSISSASNGGSILEAATAQHPKVMLPREAVQQKPVLAAPASWGGLAGASPQSRPLCTPSNVASTAWRTAVCPFAPAPRRTRCPSSLDATPTSSAPSLMTPANIWPDSTKSSIAGSWHMGQQGSKGLFSTDVTPIAAGSNSVRSRKSAVDMEWLRPILDAPMQHAASEPPTPSSGACHVTRGTSSMSLDLNTARIMEDSYDLKTPSSRAGGESGKAAADGEAFFFKRPTPPDNGPAFHMRYLGA